MDLVDVPSERTSAITDVILAIVAVAGALYLNRIGHNVPWKAALWVWILGLLAVAAALGSIAHGFKMSGALKSSLWHPIYLSLGLLVALSVVGVVYDIHGETVARRILPVMLCVGVGFFGVTLLWPESFRVFVVYEVVAMLYALSGYILLAGQGLLDGAGLMALGIFVTIVAAGVQTKEALSFRLIWHFDHNGAYHLIQMVGVVLLVAGLRKHLLSLV